MTTENVARAVRAATAHLRAHPEEGRVADRAATVVLDQGLRCRATDPVGHAVVTDMPAELGGADAGPTPGTLLRMALGSCAVTTLAMRAAGAAAALPRPAPAGPGRPRPAGGDHRRPGASPAARAPGPDRRPARRQLAPHRQRLDVSAPPARGPGRTRPLDP